MAQKQERVRKLAGLAASLLAPGNEEVRRNCERAAGLCKADLITGMVGEFPELQGIMGSEYAEHDGEPEAVSAGIREQYLPRSMEGELPQTLIGQVLSIADRMDSLAGFFHVGITPTGSEDPFALRRHATALIRTILECNHRLNLGKLIDNARNFVIADNIKGVPDSESEGRRRVADFIFERLKYYGRTIHGLREDVMEAVLHADVDRAFDLIELLDKMKAIHAISSQPAFDPLIVGFKRAHRLTEKEQWDRKPVDKALFREAAELELAQVLEQERDQFAACMAHGDYAGALDRLVRLKGPIDEFFNAVMVNTEDPAVRSNRLSLLKEVDDLFMSFADFSQIMVQGIA
jgi:glycyl-tRNA synthetase beta chain